MEQLILHPTDTSQWYALVNEAQAETRIILNENTESYLVFLLMRFTMGPEIIESVIALDFLDSINHSRIRQTEQLKEVGDKSLLFSGLFPGIAKKRSVSVEYFIDIGQSAYLSVSKLQESSDSELFLQLSNQFLDLKTILQVMRSGLIRENMD